MRDPEVMTQVKATLAELVKRAPGRAIEVRIPPYAAIQCGDGPTHTRGTPPNVIEMDASTWLALCAGDLNWQDACNSGKVIGIMSGVNLEKYFPLKGDKNVN